MVSARETTLQELLEGSKQYQVPLYQRPYAWRDAQLTRLWDDIDRIAAARTEGASPTHFIGSLVLAPSPANGPAGVQEFLVVDGQQRLTTLSVLLCAIRDHRAETEDAEHRDRINEQYLVNKWKPAIQRFKLVPTQADRASYQAVIDSTPHAGGVDRIGSAYRYFRSQLAVVDDPDDPHDIELLEEAIISGLALVCVTAQPGDNAHRIFESLNNTGLRLTQGDLLRNYIFMRLRTRGDSVYRSLWLPLQESLDNDGLELLFWLDLVQDNSRVQQSNTYAEQQARMDLLTTEDEVVAEVERFARLGRLLAMILAPSLEQDPLVRDRLQRLNAWKTTTVYPLLLHLLDRRDQGTATSEQIANAMLHIEGFFVRRLLIGRATTNLNRILLDAVTSMQRELPVDEAVLRYLSTGRKYYASDGDVRTAVDSVPFYLNGRARQRALVLQWLEDSYGSKEPVDFSALTIEHVLPQTPTPAWRSVLAESLQPGEDLEQVYESLVHTIGNLTLTGYNSTLSNSAFEVKRGQLSASGLLMNHEIAEHERWGRAEIVARSRAMAERIISLWPGPMAVVGAELTDVAWATMERAIAEIPAGRWTTYGDLAALIGSHPVPVGQRIASHPGVNAHRVLHADGRLSPGFSWPDPDRTDNPTDVLRAEGVEINDAGRASELQRLATEQLAVLIGLDIDELPDALPDPDGGEDLERRDHFMAQLGQQPPEIVHGTLAILDAWTQLGGHFTYGRAAETSCFLMTESGGRLGNSIWPFAIYPSTGRIEVVFQHLAERPPFDNEALRNELRRSLNEIDGIDLEPDTLNRRPGVDLDVVADPVSRQRLAMALSWFVEVAKGVASSRQNQNAIYELS